MAHLAGMRQGELLSLTRDIITDKGIVVTSSKTGKTTIIDYSKELLCVIGRAKSLPPQVPDHCIIRTRSGKKYSSSGIKSIWQGLMKNMITMTGIEHFTFHDIRVKSASDTPDIYEASAGLRHSDIGLTSRVYSRRPKNVQALIE